MSMSSSSTRSLVESSFVFVEALNVGSILPNRGDHPCVLVLLGLQRQAICHSAQVIYGRPASSPLLGV